MVASYINLNLGLVTTVVSNSKWDVVSFCNCNISIDWNEIQISFDSDNWYIRKPYSTLPNIEEIHSLAQLTNTSVIGASETKLNDSALNNEIVTIRPNRSRKRGGVACFKKHFAAYNYKSNICISCSTVPSTI